MEDRVIDKFIKSKIDEEDEIILSDYIESKVDEVLSNLPKERKLNKKRLTAKAAGIFLASLICLGAAFNTYAEGLFKSIFQIFSNKPHFVSEEYLKYTSHVEKVTSDKGIEIGVTDVLCDDNGIRLGYYIKSDKKIKYGPQIWGQKLLIDGEESGKNGSSSISDNIDKNTYAVIDNYKVDKLPKKFTLDWNVTNISGIEGKWNFTFNVDNEEIAKNTRIIEVNKAQKIGEVTYKVGSIKYTPLGTMIELTGLTSKENSAPYINNGGSSRVTGFAITDEMGNILGRSKGFSITGKDANKIISYDINIRIKQLPKELNIIPYEEKYIGDKIQYHSIKEQGAFTIEDDEFGKFIISGIQRNNDSLTLKLSAQLNKRMVEMPLIGLKGFLSDFIGYNQDRTQLASALSRGEEVELKFTGLKKWENYKLFFSKAGPQFELDENSKITIPVNE